MISEPELFLFHRGSSITTVHQGNMDKIMTARQCCVPAKRQVTTCEVGSALLICLQPPRVLGPLSQRPHSRSFRNSDQEIAEERSRRSL